MEAIINAFGIDVRLIIIQIVNFTILLLALVYFLYNPILNLLKNREEKIKQGIKDAEMAAMARAQAEEEKKLVMTEAHLEAEKVSERAKKTAEVMATEIVTKAHNQAVLVLKDASIKAEQLHIQVQKEAESEIAQTAILVAEKILREKAQ